MGFYKLDFLCLCVISSEKADYKDEIEITSLFNIPEVPIPRKRQEYKGLFIPYVNYQFVSIWFPGVLSNEAGSPVGNTEGKFSSPYWGRGNMNIEPKDFERMEMGMKEDS